MDKIKTFHKINQYDEQSLQTIIKIILQDVDILNISGEDKKNLALELITEWVEKMPENDYKIALLSSIESDIVADMIDMVVLASKKQLKLNKKTISKIVISYLRCCISILTKKV